MFKRRNLPWIVAAFFAVAFLVVLLAKNRSAPTGEAVNGVVQDNSGRRVLYWADPMFAQGPPHVYKSNKPGTAPDCGMKLIPVYGEEGSSATASTSTVNGYSDVALSPQRQQLIGVKLGRAEVRDLSRSIRTVGTVSADETQRAQITTKFDGFIERLYVASTGAAVRRGQPLLAVYSPDLLTTQQELILAAKNRAQFGGTLYESARRRLLLWDMSGADIDAIVRTGRPLRSVTLRSPVDGVVISKTAVEGRRVMAGDVLYDLADLRTVWVLADAYESDLPFIRAGAPAQVTAGGRSWTGRVAFVPPVIDPATRTAKIRIELVNPDGALRPEMFTDVMMQLPVGRSIAVPESAVLQTGTRSIVFVAAGNGRFDPRQVETGVKAEGFYQIRAGLVGGETVVTDANFLVDSESRLKSAMGQTAGHD